MMMRSRGEDAAISRAKASTRVAISAALNSGVMRLGRRSLSHSYSALANRTLTLRTLLGGDGICRRNGAWLAARKLILADLGGPFGDFRAALVAEAR